jgi:hypothetical protein
MRTIRVVQILFLLSAIVLPFAGCGGEKLPAGMPPPVPCEIVVTQDGQPLEGAIVRLVPTDGSEWNSLGRTDASGKMTAYTLDRYKGAVPGKYKVAVSKTEQDAPSGPELSFEERQKMILQGQTPPEAPMPASYNLVEVQYADVTTTPLEIEVKKGSPSHKVDVGKAVRVKIDTGPR